MEVDERLFVRDNLELLVPYSYRFKRDIRCESEVDLFLILLRGSTLLRKR